MHGTHGLRLSNPKKVLFDYICRLKNHPLLQQALLISDEQIILTNKWKNLDFIKDFHTYLSVRLPAVFVCWDGFGKPSRDGRMSPVLNPADQPEVDPLQLPDPITRPPGRNDSDRQRPFQCAVCARRFTRLWNLQWHHANLHGAAKGSFPCDICGKIFKNRNCLRLHMYRMHRKPAAEQASHSQHDAN